VRVATRQDVSAAASITGATTPGAAELMWGLPGGLTLGLTFIGAALPYVLQGAEHLRHRRAQVSIAHALGDYVTGSPRG